MFASLHTARFTTRKVQSRGPRLGLRGLFSMAKAAFALHQQRRTLAQLDDTALDDIGLSRNQAEAEAARPLWDVPATWLR